MITKGVILDCADKHRLGIKEYSFEIFENRERISMFSKYTAFNEKGLNFYIEDGELINKCDFIALRDFLNEIIEKY